MLSDIGPFPNTLVAVRVTMMSSEGGQDDEETLNKCLQVPSPHDSELVGKVTVSHTFNCTPQSEPLVDPSPSIRTWTGEEKKGSSSPHLTSFYSFQLRRHAQLCWPVIRK